MFFFFFPFREMSSSLRVFTKSSAFHAFTVGRYFATAQHHFPSFFFFLSWRFSFFFFSAERSCPHTSVILRQMQ